MKVAYLSNQYPLTTHTFIRREIAGLESAGVHVLRLSIRPTREPLPEPADRRELEITHALLGRGLTGLLVDAIAVLLARPRAFFSALRQTWRWGAGSHRGLLRHFGYFAEACALWRILRREGVSHVHAHFGTNATTVAMIAAVFGGLTFSFTVHGPLEFDSPQGISLGEKVERASFVAAITDFARSQTCRWSHPEHWKKIHVVRCGVDEQFLEQPVAAPPEAKRMVCVGRLGRSKGHAILIEACARLVAEGRRFEVRLVGDGELRGLFEAMVRERELEETVSFLGWKSGSEVRDELLDSRGLVLPSFGEGLPVVIMEAFALARPAIATQIAGIPELVVTGETGWLVTSGSVDALVAALREALELPVSRLLELGRAGRERVRVAHDARREAEKLAKLFASLRSGVEG
ncbi:MAG: glycosyltransferase family 4 protein [Deltaproteobacteria bacterium]|nr:glycosyltransferase family 4 protein [Deltaproteobacteria bacterium]